MEADQVITGLSPIYNRAIRTVSGLLPCTPADVACAEAGILPFRHKFAKTICRRSISHLSRTYSTSPNPDEETRLQREATQLLRRHSSQELPPVTQRHWTGTRSWDLQSVQVDQHIQKRFRAGSNTGELRATFNHRLATKYKNHTIRYTDGSKANKRVGVGVAGDISFSQRLPNQCSIFSAEAAAISHAIMQNSNRPQLIVTDSASVIAAVQSEKSQHPWIQAIQNNAKNATLMWVPGHCGIHGNEQADQLANHGRSEYIRDFTVPEQDLHTLVTNLIRKSWSVEWKSGNPFLRKIKNTTEKWDDTELLHNQRVLSRLRTGFTRFSYRMCGGGPFRIKCPICNTHNSVEHVLLNCPQFDLARQNHGIATSVQKTLGDDPAAAKRTLCYLKDIGLYHDT